jgi:hypothetical protein
MALADIPGYGGYIQRRQMNERAPLAEIEQVAGVTGLLGKLAEQDKARQAEALQAKYRTELAAAQTPEEQIAVASKYAGPEKLLSIRQGAADREAQRQILLSNAEDRHAASLRDIEFKYDQLAHQAKTDEQRAALGQQRLAAEAAAKARHDQILLMLGQQKNAAGQQPKPPPGFRYRQDGSGDLEAIPGGPKDTGPKDLARAKGAIQKADTVITAVGEALGMTGATTTGLPGQILGMVPGTKAYDLDATLDNIKANLGFAELQAMREASPTGGALGQVAVQELAMLQSTLATLKRGMSRPALEAGLRKVRQHMDNWRKAVMEANPEALGAQGGAGAVPGAPSATTPPAPSGSPTGAIPEFANEAEASAAAASGRIKAGDKIRVGGKSGTWR